MSDDLQPISIVAPKTGMSSSNLRRLALDGTIPSEKGANGRYLVRLNDVLAYCATSSRAGASRISSALPLSREIATATPEVAVIRSQLAVLEAENKRLQAELTRAHDRAERLEDRLFEIMSLYSKLMTETQALLAGATGTHPSNWIHTGPENVTKKSENRGFKGIFKKPHK